MKIIILYIFCIILSSLGVAANYCNDTDYLISYYDDEDNTNADPKPVLYLMESEDPEHVRMNYKLKELLNEDMIYKTIKVKNSSLNITILAINSNKYVVNLKVTDINLLNTLPENVIIQENGAVRTDTYCVMNITKTSNDNRTLPCEVKDMETPQMAAFSKNIMTLEHVSEIISNFDVNILKKSNSHTHHKHILVCADINEYDKNEIKDHFRHDIDLIFSKCNRELKTKNTLAVLAPKPLEGKYTIPFVFYDTHYLLPEYEYYYPISSTLIPWQAIMYAIIRFLQEMRWQRVAVISDDAYFSDTFEKEFVPLLNENQFVYTVKQCSYNIGSDDYDPDTKQCTFDPGLLQLSKQDFKVKVIVANVECHNVPKLMEAARRNGIRAVQWILRCPIHDNELNKIRRGINDIYSIHLKTSNDNSELSNIIKGISLMNNVLKNKYYGQIFDKGTFCEIFKQALPMKNDIRAIIKTQYSTTFGIIIVSDNKTTVKQIQRVNMNDLPNCYFRSDDFDKPCDNFIVCLLFLVIIMFMLILLLIIMYFSSSHNRNGQYSNIL